MPGRAELPPPKNELEEEYMTPTEKFECTVQEINLEEGTLILP